MRPGEQRLLIGPHFGAGPYWWSAGGLLIGHQASGHIGGRGGMDRETGVAVKTFDGSFRGLTGNASAAAVYGQVRDFISVSGGNTSKLTREQKGRFVATCWIAQIHKHIEDPKPGYVAGSNDLPAWQQETDADIFEAIEHANS